MNAPLSWLTDYVDITLPPKELAERLTEVGIGVESIKHEEKETLFELEITPNRPDWMSMVGIAREIAAIENKTLKLKEFLIKEPAKTTLPMKLVPDFTLFHRWSAVSLTNVEVKPSPEWLQKRLQLIGLRPINNVVDVTNYVMFELGIPLHAFDYDEIIGHVMTVEKAKGGEKFTTVDDKTYSLPKDAIIIRDTERVIDLAGIKGGLNSGIKNSTRNVFLQVTIDDPIHIRRTSQALSLRSDASTIFERGPDKGGTLQTLARASQLLLEIAGGEVASEIYDLKPTEYKPWKLAMRMSRLHKLLGIEIPEKKVLDILTSLSLSPKKIKDGVECTIPTYRNDLKIEEDLIEEVARMYGYNNFPTTIPTGETPIKTIPYFKDYRLEEKIKRILQAAGYSEIYTYGLISEKDLLLIGYKPEHNLRVDNPISREFEYLRPTLKSNLLKALEQNKPNFPQIHLFELGRVYRGKNLDGAKEENMLSGISNTKRFYEVKGILERLFSDLGIMDDPSKYIQILPEGVFFELSADKLIKNAKSVKTFKPLPKYPPIFEDLSFIVKNSVKTGELIDEIKEQSDIISGVTVLDMYEQTQTFHIVFQHPERNLTSKDIAPLRDKIVTSVSKKFGVKLKE